MPQSHNKQRPTVLYVVGQSHVGSTYLSRVLNQHPDIFDGGELNKLHHHGTAGAECSCQFGEEGRIGACDFWPDLIKSLESSAQNPSGQNLRDTSSVSRRYNSGWQKALFQRKNSPARQAFLANNRRLFEVISRRSGKPITLDCSKSPWRLLPLFRDPAIDVKVLHLMRNPRGQIASRLKRGKGFWHTAILKYWRKNHLCRVLFDHPEDYLRISFDQFLEQPDEVLSTLFRWLDIPSTDPFSTPQAPYHHFGGGWARRDAVLTRPDPGLSRSAPAFPPLQDRFLRFLERSFPDQTAR